MTNDYPHHFILIDRKRLLIQKIGGLWVWVYLCAPLDINEFVAESKLICVIL